MLDVKVVRVEGNNFAASNFDNHEVIIDMAKQGYSYKGWVPARINGYGRIVDIDLIFERN